MKAEKTGSLATRMARITEITERTAQRSHDDLNWSDPSDTAEELQKVDAWWAKHWADKATA